MSTVIGNGIRFRDAGLPEALEGLRTLKRGIQSRYEELATAHIARLAAEAIDIARHSGSTAQSPMMEAWTRFQDYESKAAKSPYRSPFDFTYEITLVPLRGAILGTVITCLPEFRAMLDDSGIASEYNYWDNADRPDGMRARDWARRRADWEDVMALDPLSRPGRAGFHYDLTPHFFVPDSARVADALPNPEARANALANHVASQREGKDPGSGGRSLMEVAREGRALRDSLMPGLMAGLLPITREDLLADSPPGTGQDTEQQGRTDPE